MSDKATFHPSQLIQLISEHAPPVQQERLMAASPLSARETICLLVLERLGFEVSSVMRMARIKRTPSSTHYETIGVPALHIQGHNWNCIVDNLGNHEENGMLAARADGIMRASAMQGVEPQSHYDGDWLATNVLPDKLRLEEIARSPVIEELVSLCQAHMLEQENAPTMPAQRHRRI